MGLLVRLEPHTLEFFSLTLQAKKVAKQLYAQEGCHPYKVAILPWVQLPLWITLSLALRNMTGFFPGLSPPDEVMASLASEGALWFHNLILPDPYYILPFILAASNLLNIEVCVYYKSNTIGTMPSLHYFTIPLHYIDPVLQCNFTKT